MNNIDKQALRDIAAAVESAPLWHAVGVFGEVVDPAKPEWKPVHDFCITFTAERVLALLDELEAAEKRIAELEDIAKSVKFDPIPMEDLGNRSDGKKHPYMFGAGYNSAVVHCESVLLQAFAAAAGKGE